MILGSVVHGAEALLMLLTYVAVVAVIASEKVDRLYVILAGALATIVLSQVLHFSSVPNLLRYIDLDVLGLIAAVSIISWFLADCGIVKLAASVLERLRSPVLVVQVLALISGLVSIFLENVSTVLLIAPTALAVCSRLGIDSVPTLILIAVASNMAGSATLVGDPPAAITASYLNLGFGDFIVYDGRPSMFFMTLIPMIVAIGTIPIYVRIAGKALRLNNAPTAGTEEPVRKGYILAVVTALTAKVVLLTFRKELGLSLSASALPPAIALLLAYGRGRFTRIMKEGIDLRLLAFLASMFIMVGGLSESGAIALVAEWFSASAGGSLAATAMLIVLVSVLVSAFVDNVPYVAAMLPAVVIVANSLSGGRTATISLAWALLIGATLGGNITYIGASANYAAVRILEGSGRRVTFARFVRIGLPFTAVSVGTALAMYYPLWLAP
ncbi:MAG: hypothetical protein J7J11_02260 [Desulfurococcales archaeon]|nr:hypothetical protein [Desulfurococcales archaeon]